MYGNIRLVNFKSINYLLIKIGAYAIKQLDCNFICYSNTNKVQVDCFLEHLFRSFLLVTQIYI